MRIDVIGFQGELSVRRIEAIPPDAVQQTPTGHHWIVGHSETGHHHVVDVQHCRLFEPPGNDLVCYLQLAEPTMLEHLRAHDQHEALELPAGIWEIRRQREWTPEGERRAID
jgi:hypothetical protein